MLDGSLFCGETLLQPDIAKSDDMMLKNLIVMITP